MLLQNMPTDAHTSTHAYIDQLKRITWLWRIVLLTTRGDKAWVIVVALVYTKTNRRPDSGIYLHHVPYGNGASMV